MDFLNGIASHGDLAVLGAVFAIFAYHKNKEAKKTLLWLRFLNERLSQVEDTLSYIAKYQQDEIPYDTLDRSPVAKKLIADFLASNDLKKFDLKKLSE